MKRPWSREELLTVWTVGPDEQALLTTKPPESQVVVAALLKYVQLEGRFPAQPHDLPPVVLTHLAQQMGIDPTALPTAWHDRSLARYRAQIRHFLGIREATSEDLDQLADWLAHESAPTDHRAEALREAAHRRLQDLHLERPTVERLDLAIATASTTFLARFHTMTLAALPAPTRRALDALVIPPDERVLHDDGLAERASHPNASAFHALKHDPSGLNLHSVGFVPEGYSTRPMRRWLNWGR